MSVEGYIFDLKRFAIHDGPGIRTTVFFSGCPLRCWWCHNPEGWEAEAGQGEPVIRKRYLDLADHPQENITGVNLTVEKVLREVEKDRVFYAQSGGGVTMSGGEPLMQAEFLYELLQACRRSGISTAVDTCGYAPGESFSRVYDLVDLFLYDLKIMDEEEHRKYTGVSNVLILENFKMLATRGDKVMPRIPLIPGITDSDENIGALIEFLHDLPVLRPASLLPYNRIGEDKFKRMRLPYKPGKLESYSSEQIENLAGSFKASGMEVILEM
ncbi:MAG: glycyl-radical enzyme activating protein [Candidatus Krumholzibacteriota bacterium]|nr:glycyl-radical enzyme activating protein [Candidatus Krumholzibacteriota bacterium]